MLLKYTLLVIHYTFTLNEDVFTDVSHIHVLSIVFFIISLLIYSVIAVPFEPDLRHPVRVIADFKMNYSIYYYYSSIII